MLYHEIFKVIGKYLRFLSYVLLVPLVVAIYFQFFVSAELHPQSHSTLAFLFTFLICFGASGLFSYFGADGKGIFYKREGLLLVISIWLLTAFIGALPFYLSGTLENFIDAYFESMSGFTTTGASVMHPKGFDPVTGEEIVIKKVIPGFYNFSYSFQGTIFPVIDSQSGEVLYSGVEAVGKALLFWRSFMQWLGGMGIVVLLVAVLPALGVGGKVLYQAEVPGPTKDVITPRIKETAGLLWKIYFVFTCLQIFLLKVTNAQMGWFDAITITFSTLSTGGFSVRNASIGAYQNEWSEAIVLLFMIIGSINFVLYFHCLKGKIYRLYEPELLTFIAVLFSICGITVCSLYSAKDLEAENLYSFYESIRYGIFQTVSAMTSTGFTTANYDIWPWANQLIILLVMFIGGMSGSTAGGIKIVRHYMLFKIIQNKVELMFRPETVRGIRIGSQKIGLDTSVTVLCFFVTAIFFTALGTALLAFDGVDLETALAVNACMINNVGIAFRMAAPTESFAFLSPFSKLVATIWMVLGRLEFFAILVVLVPGFWRVR